MQTKQCRKCKSTKKLTEFYKDSSSKDGKMGECKKCTNIRSKHYASKNKEKIKLQRRQNYNLNRQLILEKDRVYKKNYRETIKAYEKKYRETYPEKRHATTISIYNIYCPEGYIRHHWNYQKGKELSVLIMTQKEHCRLHQLMYYDELRLKYRCIKTHKLLTRQDHINLLKIIKEEILNENN